MLHAGSLGIGALHAGRHHEAVSLALVSEAWLSAVAAVCVAVLGIVGVLARNWSNRRALKEELEIARLIQDVYPDDRQLNRNIYTRVSTRLAIISGLTPTLLTSQILLVTAIITFVLTLLSLLRPWLVKQGDGSTRLVQLLDLTRVPMFLMVALLLAFVLTDIFSMLRPAMRRLLRVRRLGRRRKMRDRRRTDPTNPAESVEAQVPEVGDRSSQSATEAPCQPDM
jgi:hypothetical protein